MGLQKVVGNLIDKLRELHMNGHLEICSRPQVIENLPNILQKTVVLVNLAENLPAYYYCYYNYYDYYY